MELTLDNIYEYLENNKKNLKFKDRDDFVTKEFGASKFQTLFYDKLSKIYDMPKELTEFLIKIFNIQERDYHFLQIQKYEIGDYILPHKDNYSHFGLTNLSTSSLDGLTVEDHDNVYKFLPDKTGNIINVPKYRWHWVNPVREKTRYTAVFGLKSIYTEDYSILLDE
jgi:hypothetical protein